MMVPGGVRTLKKIATRQNDIPDSGKFISVGPKSIIWLVSIRGKSLTEEPSPSGPLCEYGTLRTQVRQSDGFKIFCTYHWRAYTGCHRPRQCNETLIQPTFREWYKVRNDDLAKVENASPSNTLNGCTKDTTTSVGKTQKNNT